MSEYNQLKTPIEHPISSMEIEGRSKSKPGRRKTCVCVTAVAVIAIVLLIIILALTVFKPHRPVTKIDSISLSDFDVSLGSLASLSIRLNVSLAVDVSIYNPNKVGFKYHDSSALLDYRGEEVGEAPIPAGEISAGETLPLNLTLTIMADRFLSNSQALTDVMAGSLPLSAITSLSGKVTILGFIHIHVVSHTTCNFAVNVASRNITDSGCSYKTKL